MSIPDTVTSPPSVYSSDSSPGWKQPLFRGGVSPAAAADARDCGETAHGADSQAQHRLRTRSRWAIPCPPFGGHGVLFTCPRRQALRSPPYWRRGRHSPAGDAPWDRVESTAAPLQPLVAVAPTTVFKTAPRQSSRSCGGVPALRLALRRHAREDHRRNATPKRVRQRLAAATAQTTTCPLSVRRARSLRPFAPRRRLPGRAQHIQSGGKCAI